MPGESYETDKQLSPPWTQDAEAEAALEARIAAEGNPPVAATEAVSAAPVPAQAPPVEGPQLHTLDNGDVVNEAGQVVGHVDATNPAVSGQGGTV
jgi:hypothetical protein